MVAVTYKLLPCFGDIPPTLPLVKYDVVFLINIKNQYDLPAVDFNYTITQLHNYTITQLHGVTSQNPR